MSDPDDQDELPVKDSKAGIDGTHGKTNMHKVPYNWKDTTREGAGKVSDPATDLRLSAVRDAGRDPKELKIRQVNVRVTEAAKRRIVELVQGHDIRQFELFILALEAFADRYGPGKKAKG